MSQISTEPKQSVGRVFIAQHLSEVMKWTTHLSKIPGTLPKVLGSMNQGLTDNPPGIWGLGELVYRTLSISSACPWVSGFCTASKVERLEGLLRIVDEGMPWI